MSAPDSHHRALLLRLTETSESFQKLELLAPEAGALLCLRRLAKKGPAKENPDLFDTTEVSLDTTKQGGIAFLREYRLARRRSGIGRSYATLRDASLFCSFLADNGPHLEDAGALFPLAERVLDAFAGPAGDASGVVLLKGLYLLVREEGYAVKESWWTGLPRHLKTPVRELLGKPVSGTDAPGESRFCAEANASLLEWIAGETDLLVAGRP